MTKKITTLSVAVGKPLDEVLDLCYAARRAVMLRGGTGVGKSQCLEGFAKKKGLDFISRDLSLMEPPDLIGLPRMDGKVTRYLPPAFLPTKGKGVLVLEEINRAPRYMRAPCLQLLTDRSLNDYRLPDGWWIAAAINPAEAGYEADELDPAHASRFVQIDVVAEPSHWLVWARENNIHSKVLGYVEADPSVFDSPMSNPRSWEHASDLLRAKGKCTISRPLLQAAISGCVGPERGAAFCKFLLDGGKPLTADEVLKRYKTCRATLNSWVEEGHLDLVQTTLLNIKKKLQSACEFTAVRENEKAWANLGKFLSDLPGDLREQAELFFRQRKYPLPGQKKGVKK
jgi:hypothetical protein